MVDFTSDDEQSPYELLGVSPYASQGEIKAAYRRLAKEYHPDINPHPEASIRMGEINYAYSILGDPAKRAAYDGGLRPEEDTYEERETDPVSYAESFSQQVRCQGCGRFDHTLRVTAFPYVISFLIMSSKRYEAGIYCNSCRSSKSTKWAVVSLLFGIWGVPFGIFWTIESLIVNALKGKKPKEENQQLLRHLAWVNVALGQIDEAKAALRDLLKYGADEAASEFKDELNRKFPTIPPAIVSDSRYGFVAIVLVIFAMYGLVGNKIFDSQQESSIPQNPPPTKSAPKTTPKSPPVIPPRPAPTPPPQPSPPEKPDNSFVKFQINKRWVTETTVEISGSVINTHDKWSITDVKIVVEILDKSDKMIQRVTVRVEVDPILRTG